MHYATRRFWQCYNALPESVQRTADECVEVEKILESLAAQPWKSFQIEVPQVISLSENAGVLLYRITAQREGSDPYVALISSTYVLSDGMWKLALHQQTLV